VSTPNKYRLDFCLANGTKFAEVTDFEWLVCMTEVNGTGYMQAQLRGDHTAISSLEHKSQIELWRNDVDNAIDWYRYFGGLYLGQRREMPDAAIFQLSAPGFLDMLSWRIVAWPAGTANRSAFTGAKAETILKTLVDYNAGANATIVNGRLRAGVITGINLEADGAHGNTLDWNCAYDELLKTLQKMATVAGGDFDLVKTAAATWELRWYTGQRGTDRTATVTFATERGNMGEPVYTYSRTNEKTVCIVGGKGEGAARKIVVRTGADYSASNDRELFYNGSGEDTTAALNSAGDKALAGKQAREEFGFKVLQTPACTFNLHYFLGDKVTVVNPFTGASSPQKIQKATLGLRMSGQESEHIDVELATP
jgi:hypothetical protein